MLKIELLGSVDWGKKEEHFFFVRQHKEESQLMVSGLWHELVSAEIQSWISVGQRHNVGLVWIFSKSQEKAKRDV